MIEIYTDGSFMSSRNQGGWGFVVLKDGNKVSSGCDGVIDTTNNRMELQACIEAIKHMKNQNITDFSIYSDSMYVIGTMTKNWKKKKNTDLWLQLDEILTTDLNIEWKHVKGHSGDKWNDHVDMLATHGSQLIIK